MILKHRDRELLRFDWVRPFGVCHVELNAREAQYLPLDFRDKAASGVTRDLVRGLEDWLLHRTAPMNRRFVRDMLTSMGFNPSDPRYLCRLIECCKGLSLNDVHWVVPDDFTVRWRDCNLYQNDFPDFLASMAFSGLGGRRPPDATTSPEYTTNGVLAKCWRRERGIVSLYKAGSEKSFGNEPYAEFYSAQVASALNVTHVDYRLAKYKMRLCSVCPLFTDEHHGYIPVGKLLTREEIAADMRFADVFLLDAVVMNDDRHLGNFGFLIDNDANEIEGVAPAFDNGHAFFSRPIGRFADCTPALYDLWENYPGLDRDRAMAQLSRLRGFHLRKDARFNLPDTAFRAAADFLSRRIDHLLAAFAPSTKGGLARVELTGPSLLLDLIGRNPGLRTQALAKLAGLSDRTAKRYLSKLKGKVVFRGAPKTGGYYLA